MTETVWLSPTEYVSGESALTLEYPSVAHPSTVAVPNKKGDLLWVYLGLDVPPGATIDEVVVCYQLTDPQCYISQIRLLEMDTPDTATVIHDDPTDLLSTAPVCHASPVGVKPSEGKAVTLALRLTADVKADVLLGAVGLTYTRAPTLGGFVVLNAGTDLVGLGYPANAVPDVPGGADAIQYAIDEFQANPDKYYAIWIPPGRYRLTKPLVMGVDGGFTRVAMIGAPRSFVSETAALAGVSIVYEGDGTGNEKQTPLLILQGMRSTHIQGIHFVSRGNPNPAQIFSGGAGAAAMYFNTSRADWVAPGVRTNPRSPQCVIAIDPFIPEDPGGEDTSRYPGFEEYYGGAVWSNPTGSSDIHFEGCGAEGGYVGVAVSPPGDVLGVDLVQNAENFEFRDFFWVANTIHFSQGQSQSRANNLHSPRMIRSWLCIDDAHVGPGGNAGINPTITGAANIGLCVWVFNLNLTTGNQLHLTQAHFENVLSLGKLGYGASSVNLGATFHNCLFNFLAADTARNASPAAPTAENEPEIPFQVMTWGVNIFENCVFGVSQSSTGLWRIWTASGRTLFRGCHILDDDRNNRVQLGFPTSGDEWVMQHVHTRNVGIGGIYQDDVKPLVTVQDIDGGGIVQVVQDPVVQSRGTIAVSSTGQLAVGDLVRLKASSPTKYVPQTIDDTQFAYAFPGPVGFVSAIAPNASVTVSGLPNGFPFAQDLRLEATTWRND